MNQHYYLVTTQDGRRALRCTFRDYSHAAIAAPRPVTVKHYLACLREALARPVDDPTRERSVAVYRRWTLDALQNQATWSARQALAERQAAKIPGAVVVAVEVLEPAAWRKVKAEELARRVAGR